MIGWLIVLNVAVIVFLIFMRTINRVNDIVENEMDEYPFLSRYILKKYALLLVVLVNLSLYGVYFVWESKMTGDTVSQSELQAQQSVSFDTPNISTNSEADLERKARAKKEAEELHRKRFPQTGL